MVGERMARLTEPASDWMPPPHVPGLAPSQPGGEAQGATKTITSKYLPCAFLDVSPQEGAGVQGARGACDSGLITQLSLQGPHLRGSDVAPCTHPTPSAPPTLTSGLIVLPWRGGGLHPVPAPTSCPKQHIAQLQGSVRGGTGECVCGFLGGELHSDPAFSQKARGEAGAQERGRKRNVAS